MKKVKNKYVLNEDHYLNSSDRISNRLLDNKIYYLNGEITNESIEGVIRWMIYERLGDQKQPLTLYINSMGGSLQDAFALIDLMQQFETPIVTVGLGSVMSAAFFIFISGTPGYRLIGENSSILCHQFTDELYGKYHDLKARMEEGLKTNEKLLNLLTKKSKLSKNEIENYLLKETDIWLTADQMIKYGIADIII